jgi:soluble lytic murein transglycosylase
MGAAAPIRAALLARTWEAARGPAKQEAGRRLVSLWVAQSGRAAAAPIPEAAERAFEAARDYAAVFPDDPAARAQLAESLYALGAYDRVVALFPANKSAADDRERGVLVCATVAAKLPDAGDAVERFFLSGPLGPHHAAAYDEIRRIDPRFFLSTAHERNTASLIRGRNANLDRAYRDALYLFKTVLAADRSQFVRNLELLGELGRAYQFGGAAKEGAEAFEKWAASVEDGDLKFRLLLYAGRMRRQLEEHQAANRLFAQALPYAPDGVQRDACLWYILDGAASVAPSTAVPLLRKYAPSWRSPAFFTDFLDHLCEALIQKKDWAGLLEAFRIVRPVAESGTVARYAYILGRAVSLGYIGADRPLEILDRTEGSGRPAADRAAIASSFFRIAFEADSASFYYRCLAASHLGENVDPVPAEEYLNRFAPAEPAAGAVPSAVTEGAVGSDADGLGRNGRRTDYSEEARFLLSFIDYGAAEYLYPLAQAAASRLSPDEVYAVALAFSRAGRYGDSIRFVSTLTRRPGYRLTRRDLELLYPRYYAAEISEAASRWGVAEDLFFGLIRTESVFISDVGSHAGAVGLAQLMRPTANDVARRIGREVPLKRDGESVDLADPGTNAMLGAWYLADLNRRLERPILSLFAYNGGITRVRRWRSAEPSLPDDLFLETVPIEETQDYGRKVLAAAAVYGYLYYGKTLERVVSEIFPK